MAWKGGIRLIPSIKRERKVPGISPRKLEVDRATKFWYSGTGPVLGVDRKREEVPEVSRSGVWPSWSRRYFYSLRFSAVILGPLKEAGRPPPW
jgi:hypothetical protein